ncbi:MAG: extracellular solute-binding protein [Spirochaetaceae bacterium]
MKRIMLLFAIVFVCTPLLLMATGQKEEASVKTGEFNAVGYPIVNDPVTLKIAVEKHTLHGNFSEMTFFKEYQEKTGVQIEWTEIPQANHAEKINLLLASGDLPDIFLNGRGLTDSHIVKYGPSGAFIPLEDLIEQYAPNISAFFKKYPDVKSSVTAPDGHIYALPAVDEFTEKENRDNMFINKKWLDKLGLEVPKTIQEFYEALKAFKEEDPNGNGKADEIPWSYLANNAVLGNNSFFGAYGVIDDVDNHLMVKNGKPLFVPASEEYKEGLKFLQKIYSEGLLDQETYTQSRKEFISKGKTADTTLGVFSIWLDENMVGAEKAKSDYVMLPPLDGPGDETYWAWSPWVFTGRNRFIITSANKNPEISIRWADWLFTEDGSWQAMKGTYGVVIEKDSDGMIQTLPVPEGMTADEFKFNHSPNYVAPLVLTREMYKNYPLPESRQRKLDRHAIYSQYFPEEYFPRGYFSEEQSKVLDIYLVDIHNYVQEMQAKWIVMSDTDIDVEWDNYLDRLEKMGLSKVMNVYDDYYKFFKQ